VVRLPILRLGLALAALGIASPAFSCAVCGLGREGSGSTYLMTAVLMSTIPLLIIGGLVYYLFQQDWRRQPMPHRDERATPSGPQPGPSGPSS
jgi:hypothetical protein